jgi:hypothetical protein
VRKFVNLVAASAAVTGVAVTIVVVVLQQREEKKRAEWRSLTLFHGDFDKHLDNLWDMLK